MPLKCLYPIYSEDFDPQTSPDLFVSVPTAAADDDVELDPFLDGEEDDDDDDDDDEDGSDVWDDEDEDDDFDDEDDSVLEDDEDD